MDKSVYVIRVKDSMYVKSLIPQLDDDEFKDEALRIGTVYPLETYEVMDRKFFGVVGLDYFVRSSHPLMK